MSIKRNPKGFGYRAVKGRSLQRTVVDYMATTARMYECARMHAAAGNPLSAAHLQHNAAIDHAYMRGRLFVLLNIMRDSRNLKAIRCRDE